MVDIQPATAENRRGKRRKKKKERKIKTTAAKHNGLPITVVDHNHKTQALDYTFKAGD